jgi:hypothetical protein
MADDLAAALVRELAAALPEPLNPELVDVIGRLVIELSRDSNEAGRGAGSELLTVAEVAARLRVSPKWVYAHQHELGPIRLGDGPKARLRFDASVVAARLTLEQTPVDVTAEEPSDELVRPDDLRRGRRRLASRPLPPNSSARSRA